MRSYEHASGRYVAGAALHEDDGYIDPRSGTLAKDANQQVILYKVSQDHPRFCREVISRDVERMKGLSHPNIVRVHQCWEHMDGFHFVEDLPRGEHLLTGLISHWPDFSERDAADISAGVVRGIAYLHEQGIAHRELNVSSVVVDREEGGRTSSVKIVDLSLQSLREIEDAKAIRRSEFPPYHLAPECVVDDLGDESFSTPPGDGPCADLWSIGVLVYTMLSGYPPIRSRDRRFLPQALKEGKVEFGEEVWQDPRMESAKHFVGLLLQVDASARKAAKELEGEAWLADAADRSTSPLDIKDRIKDYKTRRRKRHLKTVVRAMTLTQRLASQAKLVSSDKKNHNQDLVNLVQTSMPAANGETEK